MNASRAVKPKMFSFLAFRTRLGSQPKSLIFTLIFEATATWRKRWRWSVWCPNDTAVWECLLVARTQLLIRSAYEAQDVLVFECLTTWLFRHVSLRIVLFLPRDIWRCLHLHLPQETKQSVSALFFFQNRAFCFLSLVFFFLVFHMFLLFVEFFFLSAIFLFIISFCNQFWLRKKVLFLQSWYISKSSCNYYLGKNWIGETGRCRINQLQSD